MSGHRRRIEHPPIPDLGLVLIDGDNLLHRVRGMRDEAGVAWLLPRLAAWRPPGVQVTVVLDGVSDPGAPRRQRAASGITWEHSGTDRRGHGDRDPRRRAPLRGARPDRRGHR